MSSVFVCFSNTEMTGRAVDQHRVKFVLSKKRSVGRWRVHRRGEGANFTRLSLLTSSPFQRDHSVKACVSFARPRVFVQRSSLGWRRSRRRRLRKANLKIEDPPPFTPSPLTHPLFASLGIDVFIVPAAKEGRQKKRERKKERKEREKARERRGCYVYAIITARISFFRRVRSRNRSDKRTNGGRGEGGEEVKRRNICSQQLHPRNRGRGWLAGCVSPRAI